MQGNQHIGADWSHRFTLFCCKYLKWTVFEAAVCESFIPQIRLQIRAEERRDDRSSCRLSGLRSALKTNTQGEGCGFKTQQLTELLLHEGSSHNLSKVIGGQPVACVCVCVLNWWFVPAVCHVRWDRLQAMCVFGGGMDNGWISGHFLPATLIPPVRMDGWSQMDLLKILLWEQLIIHWILHLYLFIYFLSNHIGKSYLRVFVLL